MRILSVGSLSGLSNTCLHRNWALHKMGEVDEVNTNANKCSLWYRIAYHLFLYGLPIPLPENNNENKQIKDLISNKKYDVVWIDKGLTISVRTLQYIKQVQPHAMIVSFSPDNMVLRHNQSKQYLKGIQSYDYVVTNKSYIVYALETLGAKHVVFVDNTFEPSFHYPRELEDGDKERLGGDVGFAGAWEKERCDSICYLADNGIKVRVWGGGKWNDYKNYNKNLTIEGRGLWNDDYSKSFKAFKISLCFLRKMNYDVQTTRSVEIPACGGFMIAERTEEHKALFEEDKEAVYFSSNEELLDKCRYYLTHDEERQQIAEAGTARCKLSDYSNEGMVKKVIEMINK